jgi:hypothetical protein
MRMLCLADITWRTHYINCKCYAIGPTTKQNTSYTRKLFLESRLHHDSGLHVEIKSAYDADKYMLTRKSMPAWLVRQSNGLLYAYGTRLYVPGVSILRSRVMYELHDALIAGHACITRLLATITRTFWWPNMKRTIQHYVRNFVTTRQRKKATHWPVSHYGGSFPDCVSAKATPSSIDSWCCTHQSTR